MRRSFEYGLFCLLLLVSAVAISAEPVPKIYLPTLKVELGEVMHSEFAKGSFVVVNKGDAPLEISEVKTSCGCTVVDFKSGTIAPGKQIELPFSIDTIGKVGEIRKMITIKSNDPDNPEVELYAYVRIKLEEHEQVDSSAIFKGDCKFCHAQPDKYLLDEELFESVCYMCHGHYGLGGIARRINDYDYVTNNNDDHFRQMIINGVSGTSMPAFSKKHGGPLDDTQIESLVNYMRWWEEGFIFKANENRRTQ